MKILFVSATPFEILPLREFLKEQESHSLTKMQKPVARNSNLLTHHYNKLDIEILVTGVGMMATAFWLGKILNESDYDLVINAGVAGAFDKKLRIGEVVNVISEKLGDIGAQTADGEFLDIFELQLIKSNEFPYFHSRLNHPLSTETVFLPKVNGLTVNKVHGEKNSIKYINTKYRADVETMEGAAFFYACLVEKISFLEIRAISNYVEPRNKDNWNLELAIKNLNDTLIELLHSLGND